MLPHDLKDFTAEDYGDPFQLIEPYTAGKILACLLFFGAVFEKFL